METLLTYRGRTLTALDVETIRDLLVSHPTASSRELSKRLCEVWHWVQPNGARRDMVCRGLMRALHRAGHLELRPLRCRPPNPLAHRQRPALAPIEASTLAAKLSEVQPVELRQVRRTPEERLFHSLIEHHHYLGYTQPVGEHLKYLVSDRQGRVLAALAWCSASRAVGCRDRFIGWSVPTRRRNIGFLAYNTRFLILPGWRSLTLPPTCWGLAPAASRPIGNACTATPFTCSKPMSIPPASGAPATGLPTGNSRA